MSRVSKGISFPFRVDSLGGIEQSEVNLTEHEKINQSLEQIFGTRKGERVKEPEIGTELYKYLFEKVDDESIYPVIRHVAIKEIEQQEHRIEIRDVQVYRSPTIESALILLIEYTIIKYGEDGELTLQISEGGVINE